MLLSTHDDPLYCINDNPNITPDSIIKYIADTVGVDANCDCIDVDLNSVACDDTDNMYFRISFTVTATHAQIEHLTSIVSDDTTTITTESLCVGESMKPDGDDCVICSTGYVISDTYECSKAPSQSKSSFASWKIIVIAVCGGVVFIVFIALVLVKYPFRAQSYTRLHQDVA